MDEQNKYGFRLVKEEHINEISSEAFMYEHIKTKARLLYIKNDDDNKVFSISFATPPCDSCGTPHIIEHSVLCGSDRYPLKDPFVRLLKSSLSTFLNAMTFSDKTMYPIASRNEQDFRNLTDVYCDAVFNPLIKHSRFAFMQEGWHYEYDKNKDELSINGIVYNEMKGVFSDAEELILRESADTLYPDTPYANESGGLPEHIPALTYEKYLEFYSKHYHPSNSYIFVYGDTDIDECMKNLDERYLSKYEYLQPKEIPFQSAEKLLPCETKTVQYDSDEENGKYFFTVNYKICDYSDMLTKHAFTVLMKILFDTDSSVLKQALTDAKIAEEIDCDFTASVKEPYFTIIAKNADINKFECFKNTIKETLENTVREGIDADTIKACLNNYEFDLREADSGNYPKGLIYNIDMMQSWLYGADPLDELKYASHIDYLHKNETSAFYTSLIKKLLLDNRRTSTVVLEPKKGYSQQKQQLIQKKLAAFKASLSQEQLEKIIEATETLKRLQQEDDNEENIMKMPFLKTSEVSTLPAKIELEKYEEGSSDIYIHPDACSDIVYFDIDFDIPYNDRKKLALLQLTTKILGIYATERYSEFELGNVTGMYLGDTDVNILAHQDFRDINEYRRKFVFSAKALFTNAKKMFELSLEILTKTKISDLQRIYVTVCEEISKYESYLVNSAEAFVTHRILAKASQRGIFIDAVKGANYYYFLLDVKERIENGDDCIMRELTDALKEIVTSYNADVLVTSDREHASTMRALAEDFTKELPDDKPDEKIHFIEPNRINEGIVIASDVCYDAIGYNSKLAGNDIPYSMFSLRKYLRTTYLWDNIRVKGGAYGAIMGTERGGDIYLVSYRDPNIASTYRTYENINAHIEAKTFTDREINDIIIGTISDIDPVIPVYNKGRKALYDIYRNDPYEERCAFREGVLSTTANSLKECAQILENTLNQANKCCAAPKNMIEDNKEMFDKIIDIKRD